ncbi:MAG: GHKL domain-containing protein [Lachnospiraceae bacterium]|nr:GHKL domain-containing protein [Lachnospiraceae bacterium]
MNLIKKYWENVYLYVLLLTYGLCLSAGFFYTCSKFFDNYSDISWTQVILFDFSQVVYLLISIYFILKNNRDATFIPSHMRLIKVFFTVTLFIQYNMILLLFPSDYVWGCTFLFLAAVTFFFDPVLMLVHAAGYSISLAVNLLLRPEQYVAASDYGIEPVLFRIVILAMTSLCLVLLTYFVKRFLIRAQMDEEENTILLENQVKYYQDMDLMDKQLRSFRHDIRNHFISMQHLLDSDKKEEFTAYFSELNDAFALQKKLYFSGNLIVDSILNFELTHHKGKSVSAEVYGRLPEIRTVSSMDLCTVFSNMLTNAVSAANDCGPEGSELSVRFEGGKTYFSITVCNPTLVKEEPSVPDRNHGYGLNKIREVCRKYEGGFEQQLSGHIMTSRVFLPI